MDEERPIREAASHLLNLGHRRIAYVGDVICPTGVTRYDGFRRALAEARCALNEALVAPGPPALKFGAEAVTRFMEQEAPPTGIVSSSILITLGVAEQIVARKIEVPRELSFIGYGDGPWQRWWGPGLTTLRLPVEEIATGCALWLLHRLRNPPETSTSEQHIAISRATLVVRSSTGPPPS